MKNFKNKKYECYSPAQRDFILENGIVPDKEFETVWKREDRIAFLENKGMNYCPEDVKDLKRRCWLYTDLEDGSEKAMKLSELLTRWSSKNR